MEFKYNTQAKETGSYVVGACGFDSIPNDMGLVYAKRNFDGELYKGNIGKAMCLTFTNLPHTSMKHSIKIIYYIID